MYSLTFTRGWAPRPLSISFTSAGAVSIAENVALIAGVVGCWSNCGVSKLHVTTEWVIQAATTNCRTGYIRQNKDVLLTLQLESISIIYVLVWLPYPSGYCILYSIVHVPVSQNEHIVYVSFSTLSNPSGTILTCVLSDKLFLSTLSVFSIHLY